MFLIASCCTSPAYAHFRHIGGQACSLYWHGGMRSLGFPLAAGDVEFIRSTRVTRSFDTLARPGARIAVGVRNVGCRIQVITLRLVGLGTQASDTNPNLAVVSPAATTKSINSQATAEMALVLRTTARPNAGTYRATLVLTGEDGTSVTRPFTLVVAKQPTTVPPAGTADPARLLPATVKDFTNVGVNFLPSIISSTHAAGLGLGIVLVFVALPVLLELARSRFEGQGRLAGVTVLLLLAGVLAAWLSLTYVAHDDGFFSGGNPSAAQVRPMTVDPGVTPGPVGTLIADDGSAVTAIVDHATGTLSVSHVPRAGAYSGGIDLLDDQTGGEATMTLNVRDYWPYALLVIGAGVLLGAWLTRYFTRSRARWLLRVALGQLVLRLDTAEHELRERSPDIARLYSIKRVVDARTREIQAQAATKEPDAVAQAEKDVEVLDSYVDAAERLWHTLERVEQGRAQVEDGVAKTGLGLSIAEVPALTNADELLREPGLDASDTDLGLLTTKHEKASQTRDLLSKVAASLPDLQSTLTAAESISKQQLDKQQVAALGSKIDELRTAAKATIRASSPDAVATSLGSFNDKWRDLNQWLATLKLKDDQPPPEIPVPPITPGPPAQAPAQPIAPAGKEDAAIARVLSRIVPASVSQRFRRVDRQMTLAAGLIAGFSGLLALYSTSPTWGTPADYLKALLWGSVVSEGIKTITALVAKSGLSAG
jgi:hypothetical protein